MSFGILEDADVSYSSALRRMRPPNAAELPAGFKLLAQDGSIGLATTQLAQNYLDAITPDTIARSKRQIEQIPTARLKDSWGLFALTPSRSPDEPSIEDILPAAIVMYTAREAAGPMRSVTIVTRATQTHLILRLTECVKRRDELEEQALFWAWTVAVESFKTRLENLSYEGRIMLDMQVTRFPWYFLDEDKPKQILQQFFHDETFLRDFVRFLRERRTRRHDLRSWPDLGAMTRSSSETQTDF